MLTTAFKAGLVVGLFCGMFEALLISGQVLFQNSWSLSLFAGIIKLISLNAALFIVFAGLVGLVAGVVLSLFVAEEEAFKLWLLRGVWFAGLMLLFGIWLNYKTSRPLLSTQSLLYNFGAVLGALLLAEIAGRLARAKLATIQPAKNGGQRTFSLVWLGLLLLAFVPDLKSDVATTSGQRKPNVVLLIVDTLRADHLGCYGYERDTSPNIDAVAENGVRFDQAYVQWASSLPSHSSILTSLYPHVHGAFPNGKSLNPEIITLSKILNAHGYKNGAFVSNVLVGNQYNFDLNYDTFTDLTDFDYRDTNMAIWLHSLNLVRLVDWARDTDLFTELAVKWIEHHKDQPFYLWAQWLYPHAPYEPPEAFLRKFETSYSGIADGTLAQINKINDEELKFDEAGQEHYRALYDAEVAKSDYEVGRVIDKLRALNLLDNTLLVVTSDHGENLYEHRMEYGHYGVYDSSIRIPLIYYFCADDPGSVRTRDSGTISGENHCAAHRRQGGWLEELRLQHDVSRTAQFHGVAARRVQDHFGCAHAPHRI